MMTNARNQQPRAETARVRASASVNNQHDTTMKKTKKTTSTKSFIIATERLHRTLVWDNDGQLFAFDKPQSVHLVKENVARQYDSWTAFDSDPEWTNEKILATLNLLGEKPFEGGSRTDFQCQLWNAWYERAQKRTASENPICAEKNSSPTAKRANRTYTLLDAAAPTVNTPQARACVKILAETVHPETKTISESALKDAIIARAAELNTRQDPWRIFQYYRAKLIADKVLKHD